MSTTMIRWILCLSLLPFFFACGRKEEQKSKVEEAVKEAVTKEFKMYEGAKKALEKVEKEAQERREKEKEIK
ncbi:hypothetical protein EPO44_16785 [bacterium]|nr:MAG: hypothetical protein EPO44_16785 [bacterium]